MFLKNGGHRDFCKIFLFKADSAALLKRHCCVGNVKNNYCSFNYAFFILFKSVGSHLKAYMQHVKTADTNLISLYFMRTSEKFCISSILFSQTPRQCIIAKHSVSNVVSILQSVGMYIQSGGWKAVH